MRQVPVKKYLIIGNGRTAKHIGYYLEQLEHPVTYWHYKNEALAKTPSPTIEALQKLSDASDRVLLLIKDSAIDDFLTQHPFLRTSKTIHFSGSLDIFGISNVHPLISFGQDLFPAAFYQSIPFAQFDASEKSLQDFLPGLPNPSFYIPKSTKSLYHGLCVASGNLTVLLWQLVAVELEKNFHLHHDNLKPFLESVTMNLSTHWDMALTGPIARRDEVTLIKNYQALSETSLNEILKAHIKVAWPEFAHKHFNSNSNSSPPTK